MDLVTLAALCALPAGEVATPDPLAPWRPMITEAAPNFGISEAWIGAVMRAESGGRAMVDGRPITSPAGAIGLMQVMPVTYAEMRLRHGLGPDPAQLHLRYIQRDGVTRDGTPGELYDAGRDRADGKSFLERAGGDRHQFRFIVSPEDGAEYADLKQLTRRLMARMEQDLGTRLDWVAVDHYNTGHPHTHVVLRGKDEVGRDLIIARDYLAVGMRERAAEIVSLDLGPRTDREIEDRLRQEVEQERFTSLDRALLREVGGQGMVGSGAGGDPFRQSLHAGRLQKLRRLGLGEEIEPGRWHLSPELEPTLRGLGERGDIIKTMHRALAEAQLARGGTDLAIYDPADPKAGRLVGRVIERGLADEINDRHYLIVDGVDGRTHYVDIGKGEAFRTAASSRSNQSGPSPRRSIASSPRLPPPTVAATTSISTSVTIPPPPPPSPRPTCAASKACGG